MKSKESWDLDAILCELGNFGRFQIYNYCLILLPIVFCAVYSSQYIFAAGNVGFRCQVPECESSPPEYVTGGWDLWAFPEGEGTCSRWLPVEDGGPCEPGTFSTNRTVSCDSWLYEDNSTIVAEFNLACQPWKRTLVGTIHSAGLFAALPLTGYISDTFGRRTAFIVTAVLSGVGGLIRSFSTSYISYIIFEFVEAVIGSGVYSTGFILALEMVGLNRRVLGGNIISSSFALGQVVLALVAWGVPYWRTLLQVIYAPSLIFVCYYFFIEESIRWLISKGRKEEAAKIIFKAAKMNKKKLSPETVKRLTEESHAPATEPEQTMKETEKPPKIMYQVIKSRVLMSRLLVCSFWWITVTFIYYGLSINSVSLAGNSYVNYILTSLVEIPGYMLSVLTLDRFGRKSSIMTAFYICGISLISLPFIPSNLQWLSILLTMLGKLLISCVFSSIYIYTSELFPTNSRHRLVSVCSMVGRVGSMLAPQTPLLMEYMESLPYLLFGLMAGCSGLLMLLTPETLRIKLPDTVAQAESIATAPRTTKTTDILVDK